MWEYRRVVQNQFRVRSRGVRDREPRHDFSGRFSKADLKIRNDAYDLTRRAFFEIARITRREVWNEMNAVNNSPMQQPPAVLSPLRNSGGFGTGYKCNASVTSRGDGSGISNVRMIHFWKSLVFHLWIWGRAIQFFCFYDTGIRELPR